MAAVFFDLDGTLLTYDRPYEEVLAVALGGIDVPLSTALIETYTERFLEHFEGFADDPYRRGFADAFAVHGVDADPARAADRLVAAECDATSVRDGVRTLLDWLDGRHEVGVLTNGVGDVQRRKLEEHRLAGRFDATVVSYEVGAHKPAAAIFEAARERLPADGYVYVGDDREHDVEPAREAGFLPVHVRDDGVELGGFDALAEFGALLADG